MNAVDSSARNSFALRWLKFNVVGGIGVAVQLLTLVVLKSSLQLDYLLATALAVEAAVVHNFIWHERFTWADRVQPCWGESLRRLLRFNLMTGACSSAGNLALMGLLVEMAHLNYLLANVATVACCSVLNFLISDRVVFEPS